MKDSNLINAVKFIRLVPILFFVSVCIAIFFYPGGNIHDSTQEAIPLLIIF